MNLIGRINNLLSGKLHPRKRVLWIIAALVVKSAVFIFLASGSEKGYKGSFMQFNRDTRTFFDPAQNFIETGEYTDVKTNGYRMPGYGIFYMAIHAITPDPSIIFNTIGILQLIASALAAYLIALLAFKFFKNIFSFHVAWIIAAISPFTLVYNNYLLTESFSASFLVFATYFLARFFQKADTYNLIGASLFFTWSVFLRPNIAVLGPILIIFLGFSLYHKRINATQSITFFILPLILFSLWGWHNYNAHGKFKLLTHSTYYPHIENSYISDQMEFFNAYGFPQVSVAFVEGNEIYYYLNHGKKDVKVHINNIGKFPVNSFNKDSIVSIVEMTYRIYTDSTIAPVVKDSLNQATKTKLSAYRKDFISEYPFTYRVLNLFPILKDYFSVRATGYTTNRGTAIRVAVAIYNTVSGLIIYAGFVGSLFMILTWRKQSFALQALTGAICISLFLSIPVVMRLGETRYMAPAYPFLIIGFIYILNSIRLRSFSPYSIIPT